MFKKITLTVLAAATAMTAVPTAAEARPRGYYNDGYHSQYYGDRYRRGDGTTGAIIGGAGGALAGRAIDRNC